MPPKNCIIHAAAILADAETLITDGALCLRDGKIAAVGPMNAMRRRYPAVSICSAGQSLITPGLINIHTHLELGHLRGKIPSRHPDPIPFPDWVCQLFALTPPPELLPDVVAKSVYSGVEECLQFGVTAVGDITRHPLLTRCALADSPLRGISFGEITAMGKARHLLPERMAAAQAPIANTNSHLAVGLSPHAPYSVEGPALQAIVDCAATAHQPLAMHLAELPDEADFLRDFSGPLGRTWALRRMIDVLDDHIPTYAHGPVGWADQWGLLNHAQPLVLAHVNYASGDDIRRLAGRPHLSVAMCPRTRHYFGHDSISAHPCVAMLKAGIRVCLATDSLASSPDLNLLAEAAAAHRELPSLPFSTLFRMMTQWPAEAFNLPSGRLIPGHFADVAAYPLPDKPHGAEAAIADLIQRCPPASMVMIGSQVVSGKLDA